MCYILQESHQYCYLLRPIFQTFHIPLCVQVGFKKKIYMFFILLLPKFLILLTKSQNCKIFWILTFYFLINIYSIISVAFWFQWESTSTCIPRTRKIEHVYKYEHLPYIYFFILDDFDVCKNSTSFLKKFKYISVFNKFLLQFSLYEDELNCQDNPCIQCLSQLICRIRHGRIMRLTYQAFSIPELARF